MCFISFGSISGSINASNGTIFDVYLFSDCLNENLIFSQNDPDSLTTLGQRSFSVVDSVGPTLETDVGPT